MWLARGRQWSKGQSVRIASCWISNQWSSVLGTMLASQIGEQTLARGQALDPALYAQSDQTLTLVLYAGARGATCELAPNICYQ